MKRFIVLAACLFCLMLCSCAAHAPSIDEQTDTPTQTIMIINKPVVTSSPSPIPTPTLKPTVVKTPSPTRTPVSTVEPIPISELPSNGVIIAEYDGNIMGGYVDGAWLTHSQAASYCGNDIEFQFYGLRGIEETIVSTGVAQVGYLNCGSSAVSSGHVGDLEEDFLLRLPEHEEYTLRSYHDDPLQANMLFSVDESRVPEVINLEDTISVEPIIQGLLDEQYDDASVQANISLAVKADIDGDGENETIVNADNLEYDWEADSEYVPDSWYSIVCIIESNGDVYVVNSYICKEVYYEECDFVRLTNLIDIDGDGISELITTRDGYEWRVYDVLKYDGNEIKGVLGYGYGS